MGRLPVEVHPEALQEARAAREWYAERGATLGEAFMEELDRAIESIAEQPHAWPPFERGTRRYLLGRFPHSVVYRVVRETVQLVAVAHASRTPGYWRHRV